MKKRYLAWLLLLAVALCAGCGGPAEKKMKFYNRGMEYFEKKDYVKAGLEFKNAIQIDPKFDDGFYMLGMSQMMRGDFAGAFKSLGKATELNPKRLEAQVQLGKLLIGAGKVEEALGRADLVLAEAPGHEDALLLKSAAFLAGKEYDKARVILQGLLERGVAKPDVYMLLATSYARDKEYRTAEGVLVKGLQAHEKFLPMHRSLADVYMATGRTEETAAQVKKVISLEPGNYHNRITLAGLYWDTGNREKGRETVDAIVSEKPKDEARRLDAAAFYASRRSLDDAEKVLKDGITQLPGSFRLRFLLADLYRDTRRSDEAVALLKECLALDKDPAAPAILQAKVLLARVYASRQDVDAAGRYVDEVVKEDPRNLDAHLLKGNLGLLKGDGPGAVAQFRIVVDEKPRFLPAYMFLAEAHLLNRERGLALETLQRALKIDPASRETRRALAKVHAMRNEFPQAEEYLRKTLGEQPENLQAMADLGDLFVAAKDWKRAEEAYGDIKRKAPKNALGCMRMGEYHKARGEWEAAQKEYEEAVRLDPDQNALFAGLVTLYARQKKFDLAVASCEERVRRAPKDPFAWHLAGEVLAAKGERARAEEAFNKAIEADPKNLLNYRSLARLYASGEEYGKAIRVYERALAKRPDFWQGANDLAALLSDYGGKEELGRALKLAKGALERRPEEAAVLDTVGWVYFRQGDVKRAQEYLQTAQAKLPENPEINYHYGMALASNGNKEEGRRYIEKALAVEGDFLGRDAAARALQGI